jgi:hypothetical protein
VVFTTAQERVELVVPVGDLELLTADERAGLGWYSPVYGRVEPCLTVRVAHAALAPMWLVSVFGLAPNNPIEAVELVPVWAEAGALAHALALRITRAATNDQVVFAHPAGDDPHRALWRAASLETNARLLFCRTACDGSTTRIGLVDGSRLRAGGRSGVLLETPRQVRDLHVELARHAGDGSTLIEPRLSGARTDVRLQVAGRELAITADRRGAGRSSANLL